MMTKYDEATGQISVQCPDVYIALYPAGHRTTPDGKDEFYRGAMNITKGSERVHLNALDIADVVAFLEVDDVIRVRKIMTKEHVVSNMLRALILEAKLDGEEL